MPAANQPIRINWKDAVKRADAGLGDGTVLLIAASATVSQSAKTFTLATITNNPSWMNPAVAGAVKGAILYFVASGNRYHVNAWSGGTSIATVEETPQLGDTGTCYMLLCLFDANVVAGYPTSNAADGFTWAKWKTAGGSGAKLVVHAENMIWDGSFENCDNVPSTAVTPFWNVNNVVAAMWSTVTTGLSTGTVLLRATLSLGGASTLYQAVRVPFVAGKKYRLMMKIRANTAVPDAQVLGISILSRPYVDPAIDADLHVIDSSAFTNSGISAFPHGGNWWCPSLTTSAAWYTLDFTAKESGYYVLHLKCILSGNTNGCTSIDVDGIYLFEAMSADRVIALNHNLFQNSGVGVLPSILGWKATPAAPAGVSGDSTSLYTLGNDRVSSTEAFEALLGTPGANVYPIYQIVTDASAFAMTAGEVLLVEDWYFEHGPGRGFATHPFSSNRVELMSKGGSNQIIPYFNARRYQIQLDGLSPEEVVRFLEWWNDAGNLGIPLWVKARSPVGTTGPRSPLLDVDLMAVPEKDFSIAWPDPKRGSVRFSIREQL